ncbi:MAG: hypothetical protein KDC67_16095, partial [Ignavibacteriae bacterium]|nr:hypothetical protein [Ignavibacteriota bacterium]
MKSSIYSILLFFTVFFAFSQEKYVDGLIGSAIKYNGNINIEEQYYQCSIINNNCPLTFEIKSTKLYAKLWFEEALIKQYPQAEWSLKVEYSIDLYNISSGWQTDVNGPQSLTIDYRQNSNYKDIDVALYRPTNNISQNQYNAAKITITNVSVQQLN